MGPERRISRIELHQVCFLDVAEIFFKVAERLNIELLDRPFAQTILSDLFEGRVVGHHYDTRVLSFGILAQERNSILHLDAKQAQKCDEARVIKLECVLSLVRIRQMLDHQLVFLVVLVYAAQDGIVHQVLGFGLYFVRKLLASMLKRKLVPRQRAIVFVNRGPYQQFVILIWYLKLDRVFSVGLDAKAMSSCFTVDRL